MLPSQANSHGTGAALQGPYDKYALTSNPECIVIDTSWVCNLECKMCHQAAPDFSIPESPHISIELVKRLIPLLRTTKSVYMLGAGEPLMHPQVYEIISLIKTECTDTGVAFSSNGVLLNKRNIGKLIDSRLDSISISVDGPNLERGHLKTEITYKNLRALAEEKQRRGIAKPEIRLGFVIGKDNEHELIPALRFGIEIGIKGMTVEPLRIVMPNPEWDDYIRANNIYDHMDTVGPILQQARALAAAHGIEIDTPYIVNA
jgi:MoaA/NifB/PqqE/SkfB family radical SAM enzyme